MTWKVFHLYTLSFSLIQRSLGLAWGSLPSDSADCIVFPCRVCLGWLDLRRIRKQHVRVRWCHRPQSVWRTETSPRIRPTIDTSIEYWCIWKGRESARQNTEFSISFTEESSPWWIPNHWEVEFLNTSFVIGLYEISRSYLSVGPIRIAWSVGMTHRDECEAKSTSELCWWSSRRHLTSTSDAGFGWAACRWRWGWGCESCTDKEFSSDSRIVPGRTLSSSSPASCWLILSGQSENEKCFVLNETALYLSIAREQVIRKHSNLSQPIRVPLAHPRWH